jgi:hypothetical protein
MALQVNQDIIGLSVSGHFIGAGTHSPIQAANGDIYVFWMHVTTSDLMMSKMELGASGWNEPVTIHTGTLLTFATRFDRDDGYNDDFIHVAVIDTGNDDVHYYSIDTTNDDTVAGPTTIGSGTTTAAGGALSISRMRGGNLLCAWCIDGGAEYGVSRSVDTGANWTARATATGLEGESGDMWSMLPVSDLAGDQNDGILIFYDASASELSRKIYDDSADSWAETSIVASITMPAASSTYPHFATAVYDDASTNIVAVWTATDTLNADLRIFTVSESSISEKTNVVLNSTDDQGLVSLSYNPNGNVWRVWYCGASDGSETFSTSLSVYRKDSNDDGSTWGAETRFSIAALNTSFLAAARRVVDDKYVASIYGVSGTIQAMFDPTVVEAAAGSGGGIVMA